MPQLKPDGRYAMLLRKSREDAEAEKRGKFETLARHEAQLVRYAEYHDIKIAKTFRELVSGGDLSSREVMEDLLSEVMAGKWDGVLCVDLQRVTRGDMIDQGVVLAAFASSGTLIITPDRIYDPANESDCDNMELNFMVGRMELKFIKRRLQAGRLRSVQDGQYLGTIPPYGWDKVTVDRKHTLAPNGDNARMVQMYRDVASGAKGTATIARELNAQGIPSPRNLRWDATTVRGIIKNPVNMGKIRWNARKTISKINEDMTRTMTRVRTEEREIVVDGLHEGTVSEELWRAANNAIAALGRPRKKTETVLRNPLAGILVCKGCGRSMQTVHSTKQPRLRYQHPMSNRHECWQVGAEVDAVIPAVAEALAQAAEDIELSLGEERSRTEAASARIELLEKEVAISKAAKDNLLRLAERGMISDDEFAARRAEHTARIESCERQIKEARGELGDADGQARKAAELREAIAGIEDYEGRAEEVNLAMKAIVSKIEYEKDPKTKEIRLSVFLR